ncbi:MAG: MmcQ/YjbR family DNA-binding protein [Paramuribaculum sp.]|nr:MmcQ/YjbR family DNA-binding protein [Paramuribaculum sp.]MDE6323931.1 MmcQ/YjbR family DNA-binding protein [Paramuribaculum sp.]
MNLEQLRDYALSLPYVTEDSAFGPDHVLFRVGNRIFMCVSLDRSEFFTVKCDAALAIELRERYPDVEPAWHWNKKYWNQVRIDGCLTDDFIRNLIRHSYAEVVGKLGRRFVADHPEVMSVVVADEYFQ